MEKPPLTIILAGPRGFCAGVERAVKIVEEALDRWGAPVYVRHEIVHNRFVVARLEEKGAIFVEELEEVPAGRPVIFSAHGVPKEVSSEAQRRQLTYLDATCPLVSKVHREAEHHFARGRRIVLIGHAGHPEVIGTMGQLPPGAVVLIETAAEVDDLQFEADEEIAYITQTTLSLDDTQAIIAALKERFPHIHGPRREDVCYATTNRQRAVKVIAGRCDQMLVVGAHNSSNSLRLVEVAKLNGCPRTRLIARASDIDWRSLSGTRRLGLTASASAPEELVEEVIAACRDRFEVSIEEVAVTREDICFKLPRLLTA